MDVVSVDKLVKRYGDVVALDHFSLRIARGEVFGLLGPNGCGKTTAINCMLQLLTFDKGSIRLFGEPMTPARYDLKRRIGVVPQQVAVFDELTVRENVESFCALYVRDARQRARMVRDALGFVGLDGCEKLRPKKLSGGMLRRLNIACGIAHKPELIFFDEPTVAVDPQSRNAILDGIARLAAEGATVVYTSHYMEEVERICSRVMIMDAGRSLAQGTADELKRLIALGEKITVDVLGDATEAAGAQDANVGAKGAGARASARREDAAARALAAVERLPHVLRATRVGDTLHIACEAGVRNVVDVLGTLEQARVQVGRVYADPPTLNDVFLEITGKQLRD